MSADFAEQLYTPEQYLEWELANPERYEYVNGRIYAMAGASEWHNTVAGMLFALLRIEGKKRGCTAYTNAMRVKISDTGRYTYPDIVVVCGKPEIEKYKRTDTLLNPLIIIEVLSESTEADDRGNKWEHYRKLETLQEYSLVAQGRPHIERYKRHGEIWHFSEINGMDGVLSLEAMNVTIPLREIYDEVDFASGAEQRD